jgi:hypothetical protein
MRDSFSFLVAEDSKWFSITTGISSALLISNETGSADTTVFSTYSTLDDKT